MILTGVGIINLYTCTCVACYYACKQVHGKSGTLGCKCGRRFQYTPSGLLIFKNIIHCLNNLAITLSMMLYTKLLFHR